MGDTRGKRKIHVVIDDSGEAVAVMRDLVKATRSARALNGRVATMTLDKAPPLPPVYGTPITVPRIQSRRFTYDGIADSSTASFPTIYPIIPASIEREMEQVRAGMLDQLNRSIFATGD